eukprot:9864026-Prorocentrum_lima.AAC.1
MAGVSPMTRTIRLGYRDEKSMVEITQEQRDEYNRVYDENMRTLETAPVLIGIHPSHQTPSPTVVATSPGAEDEEEPNSLDRDREMVQQQGQSYAMSYSMTW